MLKCFLLIDRTSYKQPHHGDDRFCNLMGVSLHNSFALQIFQPSSVVKQLVFLTLKKSYGKESLVRRIVFVKS